MLADLRDVAGAEEVGLVDLVQPEVDDPEKMWKLVLEIVFDL